MILIPDDLNAIFDAIINQEHGTRTLKIPAIAGLPLDGTAFGGGDSDSASGNWRPTATTQRLTIAIPVNVGERIVGVRFRVTCNAGDTITGELMKVDDTIGGTPTPTVVASANSATNTGAVEEVALTGISADVTTNTYYFMRFIPTAIGTSPFVFSVEIDIEVPTP